MSKNNNEREAIILGTLLHVDRSRFVGDIGLSSDLSTEALAKVEAIAKGEKLWKPKNKICRKKTNKFAKFKSWIDFLDGRWTLVWKNVKIKVLHFFTKKTKNVRKEYKPPRYPFWPGRHKEITVINETTVRKYNRN